MARSTEAGPIHPCSHDPRLTPFQHLLDREIRSWPGVTIHRFFRLPDLRLQTLPAPVIRISQDLHRFLVADHRLQRSFINRRVHLRGLLNVVSCTLLLHILVQSHTLFLGVLLPFLDLLEGVHNLLTCGTFGVEPLSDLFDTLAFAIGARSGESVGLGLQDLQVVLRVCGCGEGLHACPSGDVEGLANPLIVAPGVEDCLGYTAAVLLAVAGEELISFIRLDISDQRLLVWKSSGSKYDLLP